jgi:hypothetical protein
MRKPGRASALAQLGSERLAALLLDAAKHDAASARTLRIEIASGNGAASVAAEVDAEIKRLKRGRSLLDRDRVAAIARDLSRLCGAIKGPLANADPEMALERVFEVIDLAPALLDRSDDGDGHIGEAIRAAYTAAAELAKRAASVFPTVRSAFRACQTYLCDEYGIADGIIADFAQALDAPVRAALRSWIEAEIARLPTPSNPDSAVERLSQCASLERRLACFGLADVRHQDPLGRGSPCRHCRARLPVGGDGVDGVAARFRAAARPGPARFGVFGWAVYEPAAFFWCWFAYDAYAHDIFVEGGFVAAAGGIAAVTVAVAMSVWRAREAKRITTYGSARWAEKREIRRAKLLKQDGVILGRWQDHYLRHDGPEHVLCFAPTRSGKGRRPRHADAADLARVGDRPRHQGRELDADGGLARPVRARAAVRSDTPGERGLQPAARGPPRRVEGAGRPEYRRRPRRSGRRTRTA